MPDFTFTSPEGKSYTITGPEGATKEQAFQMLQQRLGAAPDDGGSGSGDGTSPVSPPPSGSVKDRVQQSLQGENPINKVAKDGSTVPPKSLAGVGSAIATSGVVGGLLGAATPEILGAAATGAALIPGIGEAVAPALAAAAVAARTARTATAVTGLVSGTASEIAGQGAEALGAKKSTADTARLVAGFAAPEVAPLVKFLSKPVTAAWKAVQMYTGGGELAPSKAIAAAREALSPATTGTQPALAVHEALQQGVAADRQAADAAAREAIATAQKRADSLAAENPAAAARAVAEGEAHAAKLRADAATRAQILDKATDGKVTKADQVHRAADNARITTIAPDRPVSDIGNDIRSAVTTKQGAQLEARNSAYKQQVAARDAIVAQKEAAGVTIDGTKGMQDLKSEIQQKLLLTKKGRDAANGMAQVTEPTTARAYQQVYDAVNNKRVQVGVDADGPKYKTFKTSFEALDQVRRKLGDAAYGQQAEGFAGLGQNIAKDLYQKISSIQKEFVGPEQEALQKGYASASGDLQQFGSKAGAKATALDRMDQDKFANDAAGLPAHYFRSQQGVRDLKELSGNPGQVDQLAHQYASQQLAGMSSKQVAAWSRANSDWTREIPGLQKIVNNYAMKVEQAERVGKKLDTRVADLKSQKQATLTGAEKAAQKAQAQGLEEATKRTASRVEEQQKIVEDAAKKAETTRKAAVDKVESVIKDGYPAEATRKLLIGGTPEQHQLAMKYLSQEPGGKQALIDTTKAVMRDASPRQVAVMWQERMKPMLQTAGVAPEVVADIEAKVSALARAANGPEKELLRNKLLRSVTAATVGQAGAQW